MQICYIVVDQHTANQAYMSSALQHKQKTPNCMHHFKFNKKKNSRIPQWRRENPGSMVCLIQYGGQQKLSLLFDIFGFIFFVQVGPNFCG